MKLLITGGLGYIGSHVVLHAQRAGYEVVVVDDLSTGLPSRVDCQVVDVDLASEKALPARQESKWDSRLSNLSATSKTTLVDLQTCYWQ